MKKMGSTLNIRKQSASQEAKSPGSSVSSNPSSPVSSTKSSPQLVPTRSRQTALSKLQSAHAASHEQKLKSAGFKRNAAADDLDFAGSPASSKRSSSFSSPGDEQQTFNQQESKSSEKTSSLKHAVASSKMYVAYIIFQVLPYHMHAQ